MKFRKRQLQFMISQMDKSESNTGSQILKDISILDAIFWISRSWDEITTIQKCFAKAGFKINSDMVSTDDEGNESDNDDVVDDDDDIPLRVIQMSKDLFGCNFKELCTID